MPLRSSSRSRSCRSNSVPTTQVASRRGPRLSTRMPQTVRLDRAHAGSTPRSTKSSCAFVTSACCNTPLGTLLKDTTRLNGNEIRLLLYQPNPISKSQSLPVICRAAAPSAIEAPPPAAIYTLWVGAPLFCAGSCAIAVAGTASKVVRKRISWMAFFLRPKLRRSSE